MKYGAMNFPIRPLIDEIDELGRLRFDYIEITMDPPEALPKTLRELRKEVDETLRHYAMGMIAHMPTFVSTADLYQSIRQASVEETTAALETASGLGIEKVVLHPPLTTGLAKFLPKHVERHGLSSLEAFLERAHGLNMTVCLENMFPGVGPFTTPRGFEALLKEFPDLRMTLDIGHAFLAGGLNNILDFIGVLGNRIHHVHANDNFGTEDNHLPIGAGIIDFRLVLKELRLSGYDDTMTLEVFSRDRDYLSMSRNKVEQLWEEIA